MSQPVGTGNEGVTLTQALQLITAMAAAAPDEAALEALADFGRYDGLPPKIVLLDDGRRATLIDPISYHDPAGSAWPVPAGSQLDGASIPRPFWSIIGGPFEGKYRNASIVHDRYCDTRERPWQGTHRMFYPAMRCSGVSAITARIMFYAVYRFGPRWPDPLEALGTMAQPAPLDDSTAASLLRDVQEIIDNDLDLDAIAALAEA